MGNGRGVGKRINFRDMPPHKKHLIYQILNIYRECGYLRIYKIIYNDNLGKLAEFSEWALEVHLKNLKSGHSSCQWMFSFRKPGEPPYVPLDLRPGNGKIVKEKPLKKFTQIAISISTAIVMLLGCAAPDPLYTQWKRENLLMSMTPIEKRAEVLDNLGIPYGESNAVVPSTTYFWQTPEYRYATNIQQTISVGVAGSRYYKSRRGRK